MVHMEVVLRSHQRGAASLAHPGGRNSSFPRKRGLVSSLLPLARALGDVVERGALQMVDTDSIERTGASGVTRGNPQRSGHNLLSLSQVGRLALASGVFFLASSPSAEALPLPMPNVAQFQIAGLDATTIEAAVTSAGVLGPVVFVLVYGIAALLLIPASVLTISAGFLFGGLYGTALVSAGSTFGAALSFLVARYFARAFVEDKIRQSDGKILKAVDKAIESQGSKVVFLMRLSPLFPYSLINYSLGLTKIPFTEYIVASWLGMLPGTLAYTGIGAAGKVAMDASVGSVEATSPLVVLLYAVGAIATVLVTTLVGKTASSYLDSDE